MEAVRLVRFPQDCAGTISKPVYETMWRIGVVDTSLKPSLFFIKNRCRTTPLIKARQHNQFLWMDEGGHPLKHNLPAGKKCHQVAPYQS